MAVINQIDIMLKRERLKRRSGQADLGPTVYYCVRSPVSCHSATGQLPMLRLLEQP